MPDDMIAGMRRVERRPGSADDALPVTHSGRPLASRALSVFGPSGPDRELVERELEANAIHLPLVYRGIAASAFEYESSRLLVTRDAPGTGEWRARYCGAGSPPRARPVYRPRTVSRRGTPR